MKETKIIDETKALTQRQKIMQNTIAAIQKSMPDDVFGKYAEIGANVNVHTISTGSLAVDAVIGGGFAENRLINIVGHTSSGKTTLALTCCATLQKQNPDANILYVDAECALDPFYAESLGVKMDKIILCQPSCGENGFTAIEMFMNSGIADLVIVDSIAAMLPKALIDRDYAKDAQPGVFAKLISTAVGRVNRLASQRQCTVILINQYKPVVKMNMYAAIGGAMGNWYQPGGAQLGFFCSQILEIKKSGEIKIGKKILSSVTTMTCKKNKIAPPYRSADFVITYGKGLDRAQELIGLGLTLGIIKQAGSFYSIPDIIGEQTFQGRSKLGKAIEKDPELLLKLEEVIKPLIATVRDVKLLKTNKDDESLEDEEDEEDENLDEFGNPIQEQVIGIEDSFENVSE